MPGIQVPVGIKNAGFRSGLDDMRKQAKTFASDVKGEFLGSFGGIKGQIVGAFGLAAIGAAIGGLIAKGGEIQDLSERFDASAESLQRIGNVAAQNGSSLEAVGAALNKAALAQEAAKKGSDEHLAALETLKIGAEEFINLSAEEAFYRIADATKNAEDRQAAYDAVIKLMGKSSGELFTTLEMGGDAIRELGESIGVYSDESIARLDEMGDALDKAKNRFAVASGEIILVLDKGLNTIGAFLGALKSIPANGWSASSSAFSETMDEIWNPPEQEAKAKKPRRELEDKEDKDKSAEKAADKRAKLEENIAKLKEEARIKELGDAERLYELEGKLAFLKASSNEFATERTDEQLAAEKEALEVAKEKGDLEKKMAEEKTRTDEKEKQLREKHDEDLAESLQKERDDAEKEAFDKMTPAQKRAALQSKEDAAREAAQTASDSGDELGASKSRLEAERLRREREGIADAPVEDTALDKPRIASVSVDSLQAIGGGGGIGASADPQLRKLDSIDQKLERIARAAEAQNSGSVTRPPIP